MMKVKVLLVYFFVFMASAFEVCAQKEENPKLAAAKDYMFHKQMVGGIKLATTGLDFYVQYGIIKNIYVTHLFTLEYEWHIDYRDKKTKSITSTGNPGRDYFFGVQNRFHTIRFSYGFEKAIADKAAKNGVRLSWVGFIGGALGLVKPYYLNLNYGTNANTGEAIIRSERYSPGNASVFLDQTRIDEASPISRGLNQISPVIGGHARTGLNFDLGSRDAFVKAIEAGVSVDIFYKKIPIYVTDHSNHFFFFGLYLAFHMGKRW
jgi:hypothetical protein